MGSGDVCKVCIYICGDVGKDSVTLFARTVENHDATLKQASSMTRTERDGIKKEDLPYRIEGN